MFGSRLAIHLAVIFLSWRALTGTDGLPRVLILGDQVYQQPANELKKELKGKIEVHYPRHEPGFVWNSSSALEVLDQYLGDEKWDLIYFNCGLGDLVHRAPKIKSFRVMPRPAGGIRATDPRDYERNLDLLVRKLKSMGSKILWASTSPIRHSSTDVFVPGSEIEYNSIASGVMRKHEVPVVDMYSYVRSLINMDKPASHGADPFHFDRKPIHSPVREAIVKSLRLNLQP